MRSTGGNYVPLYDDIVQLLMLVLLGKVPAHDCPPDLGTVCTGCDSCRPHWSKLDGLADSTDVVSELVGGQAFDLLGSTNPRVWSDQVMEKLNPEQAYDAMVQFFDLYFKRTRSDALAGILGGLQFNLDPDTGERLTFDPAYWGEWLATVRKVADGDELTVEQAFDAIIEFLEIYQRTGFVEGVDTFLKELSFTADHVTGKRQTARRDSWAEWLECVQDAAEVGPTVTYIMQRRFYYLSELELRILDALLDERPLDFLREYRPHVVQSQQGHLAQ
jgi:hypothetical protein